MKKVYMSVGEKFTDTPEKRALLDKAISEIEWHDKSEGKVSFPFMQGYGMKALIQQRGNNADRYGYAAYFGKSVGVDVDGGFVYGMRNNYNEGDVRQVIVYAIDDGLDVTPVIVIENPEQTVDEEIASYRKTEEANYSPGDENIADEQ